jgi:hypothetical protein
MGLQRSGRVVCVQHNMCSIGRAAQQAKQSAYPDVKADWRASCDLQVDAEAQRAAAWQLRQQAVLEAVAARPAASVMQQSSSAVVRLAHTAQATDSAEGSSSQTCNQH